MAKLILAEPQISAVKIASICVYVRPKDETENPFTPRVEVQLDLGDEDAEGDFVTLRREARVLTGDKFVAFVSAFQTLEASVLQVISQVDGIAGTVEG